MTNNGHFWTCPKCKRYNLHNWTMRCSGCGYSGYYPSPHQCTPDCKAIQDALIDTYNKPSANQEAQG